MLKLSTLIFATRSTRKLPTKIFRKYCSPINQEQNQLKSEIKDIIANYNKNQIFATPNSLNLLQTDIFKVIEKTCITKPVIKQNLGDRILEFLLNGIYYLMVTFICVYVIFATALVIVITAMFLYDVFQ